MDWQNISVVKIGTEDTADPRAMFSQIGVGRRTAQLAVPRGKSAGLDQYEDDGHRSGTWTAPLEPLLAGRTYTRL